MGKVRGSGRADGPRKDVYQRVTDKIIAQLEAGTQPWHQPWGAGGSPVRPLRHNAVPYRGINTVLLWMEAAERGYLSPYWMTYKQAQQLGGQVRRGEKSTMVVYASTFERTEADDNGEEVERRIAFMKEYRVFSADQIDNLSDEFYVKPEPVGEPKERIAHAGAFIAATGAEIRVGGNSAFYNIKDDFIGLPPFDAFESAEAHAIVTCHELAHWTRHPSRLNRDLGRKQWGDEGYAREELVACLSQVFLAADLGLEDEPREDHAAYLASWIEVLRDDRRAIFQAASHAEKAVTFLHDLQPRAEDQADENHDVAA